MRMDSDIKRDVESELKWDPDIDATDIGVAVKSGVVTLSGFVRSFNQKYQAEKAAKRVKGVLGVANDIEVRLPSLNERPDPELARSAVEAIKNELPTPTRTSRSSSRTGGSPSRATPNGSISASALKRRSARSGASRASPISWR